MDGKLSHQCATNEAFRPIFLWYTHKKKKKKSKTKTHLDSFCMFSTPTPLSLSPSVSLPLRERESNFITEPRSLKDSERLRNKTKSVEKDISVSTERIDNSVWEINRERQSEEEKEIDRGKNMDLNFKSSVLCMRKSSLWYYRDYYDINIFI